MSFQLYLRRSPRTLYLLGDDHALVFRQLDQEGRTESKGCATAVVELQNREDVVIEELIRINKGRGIGGVLGLTSVPSGELASCGAGRFLGWIALISDG
jgi:hypothetical protein